jgi:hypothetical protein
MPPFRTDAGKISEARHLKSRGVRHKAAHGAAYCGRGTWFRSNLKGMTRSYPVACCGSGRLLVAKANA